MPIEIIRRASYEERITYSRVFDWRGHTGWGFSFDCDEKGDPDLAKMPPEARENFQKCLSGEHDVVDRGVRERREEIRRPALGRCECGETVMLSGFTNTCERCGADYNRSGQRLAPREQWGWDTGEDPSDILRIP